MPRSLKVFLCHASDDKAEVKALYAHLTADGVDAWLDKEKLLPGQDWRYEIQKAVREADVVIVCHSKSFNREGFRQREVRWALDIAMEKPEGEIFIIPARLEECDVLDSLKERHWVDLFEDDGYKKLMMALQVRAASIGAMLRGKKRKSQQKTSPIQGVAKSDEDKEYVESERKPISKYSENKPVELILKDGIPYPSGLISSFDSGKKAPIGINSNSVISASEPGKTRSSSLDAERPKSIKPKPDEKSAKQDSSKDVQTGNLGVGGDVSGSVIVLGHGNVINMGAQHNERQEKAESESFSGKNVKIEIVAYNQPKENPNQQQVSIHESSARSRSLTTNNQRVIWSRA